MSHRGADPAILLRELLADAEAGQWSQVLMTLRGAVPDSLARAADLRAQLATSIATLGADELAVLVEVAAGLVAGRAVYGELDAAGDGRDFERETAEEIRDALAYIGARLVQLRHRSCPQPDHEQER